MNQEIQTCQGKRVKRAKSIYTDRLDQRELGVVDGVPLGILVLNTGHRVQRHADLHQGKYSHGQWEENTHRGDDDEGDGDDGDDLGGQGGVRLLYQVPEADLVLDKLPRPEVLLNLLLDVVRLLLHLLHHVLLACVVLVLAAGLQEHLVYHPVLEVVAESQNAHLVYHVEFPCERL